MEQRRNRPPYFPEVLPNRGFTLIELLIALAIGMVIMTALTVMFVNQSKIRSELDKSNRMTDNGRYAMTVLSDAIKLAGYYGEFDPSSVALPGAMPDPCSTTSADIAAALRLHLQSYDAATTTSVIASAPSCIASSMIKAGSDILVVRRVETNTVAVASATNGTHYLQPKLCQYDAVSYKLSTTVGDLTLRQKNCTSTSTTPYADAHRMLVQIYFVSPYNRPGDGIPTLKRAELVPTGWTIPAGTVKLDGTVTTSSSTTAAPTFILTPLVEGIEFIQFDYGIDTVTTDGQALADSYTNAPADVTQMSTIVDVKVHVLARNLEATTGHADAKVYDLGSAGTYQPTGAAVAYKRQAYSQFVRVMNAAGRREMP